MTNYTHNQHTNLQFFNPIYTPEQLSRLTTFLSDPNIVSKFTSLNQSQTSYSLFYLVIDNQTKLPMPSFHTPINNFLKLPPASNNASKTVNNSNPIANSNPNPFAPPSDQSSDTNIF